MPLSSQALKDAQVRGALINASCDLALAQQTYPGRVMTLREYLTRPDVPGAPGLVGCLLGEQSLRGGEAVRTYILDVFRGESSAGRCLIDTLAGPALLPPDSVVLTETLCLDF